MFVNFCHCWGMFVPGGGVSLLFFLVPVLVVPLNSSLRLPTQLFDVLEACVGNILASMHQTQVKTGEGAAVAALSQLTSLTDLTIIATAPLAASAAFSPLLTGTLADGAMLELDFPDNFASLHNLSSLETLRFEFLEHWDLQHIVQIFRKIFPLTDSVRHVTLAGNIDAALCRAPLTLIQLGGNHWCQEGSLSFETFEIDDAQFDTNALLVVIGTILQNQPSIVELIVAGLPHFLTSRRIIELPHIRWLRLRQYADTEVSHTNLVMRLAFPNLRGLIIDDLQGGVFNGSVLKGLHSFRRLALPPGSVAVELPPELAADCEITGCSSVHFAEVSGS